MDELYPIRLEDVFQSFDEDEWDNSSPPKPHPKLGNITTVTFKVDKETETEMKIEEFECPICYSSICKWDAVHLNCEHVFCGSCIITCLDTLLKNHVLIPSCALCRTEYTFFDIPNPENCNKIELRLRNSYSSP
jgi:hypothetical protein